MSAKTTSKTTTRRDRGTGSIFQRSSDGRWVGTLELPSGGARRRKQFTASTREGVVRKMREYRRALTIAGDLVTSAPTLEAFMRDRIARKAADRIVPTTARSYLTRAERWIFPEIGRVRVDKITAAHFHQVHAAVRAAGRSPHSVRGVDTVLRGAMREAFRLNLITDDVAARVVAPSLGEQGHRDSLTAEQARHLLATVQDNPVTYARLLVAFLTGMRQGEALGLTWEAVDLERGTIRCLWQVQALDWEHGCPAGACGAKPGRCPERRVLVPAHLVARVMHGSLALVRPKSVRGRREMPMAGALAEALRAIRPADAQPGDLVFADRNGHPIRDYVDRLAWTKALRRAGLPNVDLHSARHTCGTLLGAVGADEAVRMQYMGHSTAAVNRIYVDTTGQAAPAVERLGALLRPAAPVTPSAAPEPDLAALAGSLTPAQRAALLAVLLGDTRAVSAA